MKRVCLIIFTVCLAFAIIACSSNAKIDGNEQIGNENLNKIEKQFGYIQLEHSEKIGAAVEIINLVL